MKNTQKTLFAIPVALILSLTFGAAPLAGQAVDEEEESYEGDEFSLPVKPEGSEEPFDNDALTDAQNDASQRIPDVDDEPLDTPREKAVEEYNESAAEYNRGRELMDRAQARQKLNLYPILEADVINQIRVEQAKIDPKDTDDFDEDTAEDIGFEGGEEESVEIELE